MGIAQVAASSRQGVHKANAYCPSDSESRTIQAAIKIGNEKRLVETDFPVLLLGRRQLGTNPLGWKTRFSLLWQITAVIS